MVDPAIIELMQQLTRPTPGVIVSGVPAGNALPGAAAATIAEAERDARRVERETAEWVERVERGLSGMLAGFRARGIDRDALDLFPGLLAEIQAAERARTTEYERGAKHLRRMRKHILANAPWFLEAFDGQTARVLAAMARRNLAMGEFALALRAFHAEATGRAARGAVYTDGDSLRAALRAAIA